MKTLLKMPIHKNAIAVAIGAPRALGRVRRKIHGNELDFCRSLEARHRNP